MPVKKIPVKKLIRREKVCANFIILFFSKKQNLIIKREKYFKTKIKYV